MDTPKRIRRTKVDIEEQIIASAIQLIEKKGFSDITLTGIAQKAHIEPIVFYNRYKDLNGFFDELVKQYDYWFSDTTKGYEGDLYTKEGYSYIFKQLFDSLSENKMMQQLLKWELSTVNQTTIRTAGLREFHTIPLVQSFEKIFQSSSVDISSVSAFLVGGIYYLILHKELSKFSGIDVSTDAGKEKIHKAIDYLSTIFFKEIKPSQEVIDVAKKMKQNGIEKSIIITCTGLSDPMVDALFDKA